MKMVGHNDVAPHDPLGRVAPQINQQVMNFRAGKYRLAMVGAHRHENQYGPIAHFVRGMSRGFLSGIIWHSPVCATGPNRRKLKVSG